MKVSIITVCYNSAKTIERTLLSIQQQTYPFIEHIVVDGASQDGTQAIIERYRAGIASVISEPDAGIYDAMNKGIALATGEVIGFLNADDILYSNQVISKIVKAFEKNAVDAVYSDLIYAKGSEIVRYWRSSPFKQKAFLKGWNPPHPTFYVKKSVYDRYGCFNLNYKMGNDIELMMRFLECHHIKTAYVPGIWVSMQVGGVSNQQWKNIVLQNKEVIRAARDLNLPMNVLNFVFHKLVSRIGQRLRRGSV